MSDATSKFDAFNAGDEITVTVSTVPTVDKRTLTIQRLMRRDPRIVKALKAGQTRRRQTPRYEQRGGRQWHVRERCGKVAIVKQGASWNMTYTHDLADDLRSVEKFLDVAKA